MLYFASALQHKNCRHITDNLLDLKNADPIVVAALESRGYC